jgi:hypothetical protein
MGTASDHSGGGTGGAWTGFKHGVSNYARRGGPERAARVLKRWVATQGGAGAASGGSRAAVGSAQRFASLLSGVASDGLASALESAGLEDLVGRNRLEVLEGLLEAIAGDGSDLDQQAIRAAVCDLYDDLFSGQTFEELEEVQLDAHGVVDAIEQFLAAYIYRRMLPQIDVKLRDLDAETARARERELRDFIHSLISLRINGERALSLDWRGQEGRGLIEGVVDATFEQIEHLEDT